jgi:LytS/YehU family sensor histidine kinase
MTVLLAKVFRHVLTHTDKSFSTVEEEIDFVRTYLEIEKVRFGDRLSVQIEVSKAAEGHRSLAHSSAACRERAETWASSQAWRQ